MHNIQKYSILAILTLTVAAGIFNNIPSLYAQGGNQTTTPMANQTQSTPEEEEQHATEDATSAEHATGGGESDGNKTSIPVRDSSIVLLQDTIIPAGDYLHLYDTTPDVITSGHVAIKVPCEDDSTTPIQVLIGQAPNMTAAPLENIAPLSTPGEQCLYHADLSPNANITTITDVALSNPTEEDIEFLPTSTVVIGINDIMKKEHGHAEGTEEHAASANSTTTPEEAGHT